jgi:hypothetical protein
MTRPEPRRLALACAIGALLLAPLGCSLSYSSQSISKSVSSPFKSSSGSSGEADDPAYQEEVASYTAGFAGSGGDTMTFQRGVASIAERRGISNWEDDDQTCRAIGKGLRKAGLDKGRAESMAGDLLSGRADRVKVVMKGYAAAK